MLRSKPVRLEQALGRRRCAEVIDADDLALQADVAPPLRAHPGLDRHAPGDRRRQHALLVRIVLGVEGVGARHGYQSNLSALGSRGPNRFGSYSHLRTGSDPNALWL